MLRILNPNETYTFSRYFELKIEAEDLAKEFGYTLETKRLNLPQYTGDLDRIQQTQSKIEEILPYVTLSNESARREWLIAPLLADVIHYTKAKVKVEYPIRLSNYLQGSFDYLIEASRTIIIVEAKKADLDLGMTQLVAQLITLDQWQEPQSQPYFIGAVTTGKNWEFARLNRHSKHFERGFEDYSIPDELEQITRILVQELIG
jgi:hypothetical protein